MFKERENGREWERDNYYKSVVLRLESERRTNAKKGGGWREKTKKKRERVRIERERCKNVLPSRSPKHMGKSLYTLSKIHARYLLQLQLARYHTHAHTFATNISLSLPLKTSTTTTVTITVRSKNTRADRTFSFPSTRSCARRVPTFLKIPPGSRRSAPLRRL